MKINHILFLTFAGLLCTAAIAESPPQFRDQPVSYKDCSGKSATAHVPLFNDESGAAGPAINDYVYKVFLRAAPPHWRSTDPLVMTKDSFFDGQTEKPNARVKYVFDGRMVEVAIDWRECDRIVDTADVTYRFDARTGRLIDPGDLLTPAGKIALGDRLRQQRRRRIVKLLARVDRQIATSKEAADRKRYLATKEIYEKCVEERFGEQGAGQYTDPLWIGALDARGVTFKAAACASHMDAALDELGDFSDRVSVTALRPYLSTVGRYLFFGEKAAPR